VNNKKNKISLLPKFTFSCLVLALLQYSTDAQDNTEATSKTINEINNQNIRAFMEEELECVQYVFSPGDFPKIRWKNEVVVENEIGKFPLKVKYFNSNFQQVTTADKPGRYGAVIEGVTPSGFTIKRYVTLFCTAVEFDDYSNNVPIKMNQLLEYDIDSEKWEKYKKNEEHFSFGSFKFFPIHNADAAIFLAGLNDMEELENNFDTPRIRDRQWWITMKSKLEAAPILKNPLVLPQSINDETLMYLKDTEVSSSEYDKKQIENLREICHAWAEKGGAEHVTMIVHKGKIIFHESFGIDEAGKPVTKESNMWMASITKLLTGVLMMQFVDQRIVDLDAPVNRYLPELTGSGNDKLTVRHLFTHTSGLHFAGEWASDWNYALENHIAHVLPSVDVGKSFSYHRAGYALAGKIMERITGRAVPYLFHDYIFSQLGMKSAYSDNTYGGLYCTANDLAHLGQLLLNKGSYNGYRFFSEHSFNEMLPKKLTISNRRWGIGTSPKDGHGLSELAFGHGAASGTVFCVDPKNDLIIISARNKPGKMHDEFEKTFIENSTSLLKNH
jgi:CubicO group peptidase (beta-lactamase class C family)